MHIHTIDASNRKLGRVASEAAEVLMGKNSVHFVRNAQADVSVVINHASKLDITEKRLSSLNYQNYSGYPGGRKVLSGREMLAKKGYRELLRRAIFGMLPTN